MTTFTISPRARTTSRAARSYVCTSNPAPGAPRFDWTLRPPQAAGMSSAGVERIRATLKKLVDDGTINGVVSAVARRNKLVLYEAQGFRDAARQYPMPRDGIFRMMSSTKPLTAVAVLMMVEEGRLSLDDKVSRFIPSWKNQRVAIAPPGGKDAPQVQLVPLDREITISEQRVLERKFVQIHLV